MLNEKDKKSLEEELLDTENQQKEDEVQINAPLIRKRSFNNKFKYLQVRYKKDPKKFMVYVAGLLMMLSAVIGSSYAYLSTTSKTNSSVVISSGMLALTFQNEENTINLNNALPMTDEKGLKQDNEYSFDIKNNGSIPATYTITLDNTCSLGDQVDACIPNDYIKVGIKEGNNNYKVLNNTNNSRYVIDSGLLQKEEVKTYKMKIWLDYSTPNMYNAKNKKNIVYKAKLALSYEQGSSNLASEINNSNYTVNNLNNNTSFEIKNDGIFEGLTSQPYIRIKGNESTNSVNTSWSITQNEDIGIIEGSQYELSFYVRSENALVDQFISVGDVDKSTTQIVWNNGTTSTLKSIKSFENDGIWHLITETFTAPAGATSAKISIGNDTPDLYGEGSYIDIAGIKFIKK